MCYVLFFFSDRGFKEKYEWSDICEPDEESDIDPHQVPSPCPEGTFYKRSKG